MSRGGLIQLHHGQASKTPLSIEQWTTCFNVFIAIYILKSPAEAGNRLKYAATIRELHSNHGDLAWRQYDEGFRRLRPSHRPPRLVIFSSMLPPSENCTLTMVISHGGSMMRASAGYARLIVRHGKSRLMSFIRKLLTDVLLFSLLSHLRQGVGVMGIILLTTGPFVTGSVSLTTEVRPVQTPVDSDILARSAGQPPIQKLNVLNCYTRGQLRSMQRNPTLPTPVQPDALKQQLHGYREDLLITLLNGFTFGFRLGYEGSHHHSSNHKSVRENRDIVETKLQKELDLGRIHSPFSELPFTNCTISPLGLVPKSVSGKYRLIHDLSYPQCWYFGYS